MAAWGRAEFDPDGKARFLVGVLSDNLVQKRMEKELRISKATAEKANASRTQFFASLSHELRTPLAIIIGFADLALDDQAGDASRIDFLRSIRQNGEHLLNLVNQLLDLSKMEGDRIDLEQSRAMFRDLIVDSTLKLRSQAEKKKLSFSIVATTKVPKLVEVDPMRFRQVMVNVIDNAIKSTSRGGIEIKIEVLCPVVKGRRISMQIAVKDTGSGIPLEAQSRLFEPFSRPDSTVPRRFGGSGLGLPLARGSARKIGGNLTLESSAPGKGSVFLFTFLDGVFESEDDFESLQLFDRSEDTNPSVALQPSGSLAEFNVLLADDALDNRNLVAHYLRHTGARTDFAVNGAEAIKKAEMFDYDVVLMDIQMPIVNGLEATRALRDLGYDRPIVAVTAQAMPGDRERSKENGFDEFLTKPLRREELLATLTAIAERGGRERGVIH